MNPEQPRPSISEPGDLRDGIKAAYRDLRRDGYFCRSNFWCCQTCALYAIPEGRGDKYVFYHRQDNHNIDRHGDCYLAWGGDGRRIVGALEHSGLEVEWDGSPNTRIRVRPRAT